MEEYMEASLYSLIEEDIAECLKLISTNGDVTVRYSYGRFLLKALSQPIDRVLQDICTIASTLLVISEDKETVVRHLLLREIPEIVVKCRELATEEEDIDTFLYDRLLDIMLKYLVDVNSKLRKDAFFAVKQLLQKSVVDDKRILEKVCPAVVNVDLSSFPLLYRDVDYSTNTIELMALLATIIGSEHTKNLLLGRFCELCSDGVNTVRRCCADHMAIFCDVVGQTVVEAQLLPIFKLLCEDGVWRVRKSAAECLPKVALVCSLERRKDTLAPLAFNLLNDASRFVSGTAFENLGQLIATFAEPCAVKLEYDLKSSSTVYIIPLDSKNEDIIDSDANTVEDNVESSPQHLEDTNSILEKLGQNPFKWFMCTEPFSGNHNTNPIEWMKLHKESFPFYEETANFLNIFKERVTKQSFKHPQKDNDNTATDNQPEMVDEKMSSDNGSDDDDASSSGCSSASSTDGCDNNANIDECGGDMLTEPEADVGDVTFVNGECDLNEAAKSVEMVGGDSYMDDFYDEVPTGALSGLPDGLRELVADIRQSTHAEIRRRLKMTQLRQSDASNSAATTSANVKPIEVRCSRVENAVELTHNKTCQNDSPNKNPHNSGLPGPLRIPPGKVKKLKKAQAVEDNKLEMSDSNTCIIDDTFVTLRKKIASKIASKINSKSDSSEALNSSEPSNTPDSPNLAECSSSNEDSSTNIADDQEDEDLKEFNSLNYWYISPVNVTVDLPKNTIEDVDVESWESPDNDDDVVYKENLDKLKASCVGPDQDPKRSYFSQSIVPPYLVEYFVSMEHFANSDFKLFCVYNFPAVVLTLKQENWHLMYDVLLFLAGDIQWKVRKTIAMFICDIAQIIGRENTHRDLLPIFLGFFKDLDEVKIEALKNLPKFLSVIDVEEHPKVIVNLGECLQCDNDSNWRFRSQLGHQLVHLITMYSHIYRVDYMVFITGMAIMMLTDTVSAVRTVAMEALAAKVCNSTEIEFKYLLELCVDEFAHHRHWRRRQMFIRIWEAVIVNKRAPPSELIERKIIPHILELAMDRIPNVRIAVIDLLTVHLGDRVNEEDEKDSNQHSIVKMLKLLKRYSNSEGTPP